MRYTNANMENATAMRQLRIGDEKIPETITCTGISAQIVLFSSWKPVDSVRDLIKYQFYIVM